jgi:hypothetical protein
MDKSNLMIFHSIERYETALQKYCSQKGHIKKTTMYSQPFLHRKVCAKLCLKQTKIVMLERIYTMNSNLSPLQQ